MRGEIDPQPEMFSYVDLESRILPSHPTRKIRHIVDAALMELEPTFAEMYSDRSRPSIPLEQLLRAVLLQILFTIRSELMMMERIDYDLLVRGLGDRRFGAEPFGIFEGPGSPDGLWCGRVAVRGDQKPSLCQQAAVTGSFYGGWHANRGLCLAEVVAAAVSVSDSTWTRSD